MSNHIFIITFSAATWSDEEEALIAEFQAILATTSRNALVGAGDTLQIVVTLIMRMKTHETQQTFITFSVALLRKNYIQQWHKSPLYMIMLNSYLLKRMTNGLFVQVKTTKRLLFPTDNPEAITEKLNENESELAETPRSILSTTSRQEVT